MMMKFVVKKNGKPVGKPFDSLEEAEQLAESEKFADPSADVQVSSHPVLIVGEEMGPAEGQALVDEILDGADFSGVPPEHMGTAEFSAGEQDEASADPEHGELGEEKEPAKKGNEMSAKGSPLFVSHPSNVPVADEVLENLWAQNRIAVHLPGEDPGGKHSDHEKPWSKMAAKLLANLAAGGGYAWVETRVRPGVAKVGRIPPQRLEELRTDRTVPKHTQHAGGGSGSVVILRTLRLEAVREISSDGATALRAERPLTGTIRSWKAAGSRLEAMVEGIPLERTWNNLTPLQQQAVCAEFLRSGRKPEYPKLEFLLALSGAKLGKADIFGIEEDGTEVLARVTSSPLGGLQVGSGARALKKEHQRPGRRLILFCSFLGSADTASSAPSLFPLEPIQAPKLDGVLLAPVEEVLEWVNGQPLYADKLFAL